MWVKAEYAGELAVLSAWLGALVPWNVQNVSISLGSTLYVRFPLFQVQFASLPDGIDETGIELGGGVWVADVVSATLAPSGIDAIFTAFHVAALWGIGAAAVGGAVVLSVALYSREEAIETKSPVDPVRVVGGLLGAGAVAFGLATYRIYSTAIPGTPVPVGVAVLALLSAVLLTVDRTEDTPETAPEGA